MISLRWLFFSSEEEEAAAASEIAMASFLQLLLLLVYLPLLLLRLSGNIFARTPTSPPISENDIIERRRHSNAVGEEAAADPTVPSF